MSLYGSICLADCLAADPDIARKRKKEAR